MITESLILKRSSFGVTHRVQVDLKTAWLGFDPEALTCAGQLARLVKEINENEVKENIEVVFLDLLRLLECLGLIEGHLRQVDAADETFALFQLIHDDARKLVEFIRTKAMNSTGISDYLADTLDGVTFVINHDLQRVFESDCKSGVPAGTTPIILSKMHRAHDVLTNCLQQSTISLAMVFDRSLVGAKLFNNSDMRYKQSLQLCQDLLSLRQLVESFESDLRKSPVALLDGIARFRSESMEGLAYSDWPQFESFCEKINVSWSEPSALLTVLHQFQCYIETLLSQVRMRAVFAEASDQSAEGYFSSEGLNDPILPSQDDNAEWADLALAV